MVSSGKKQSPHLYLLD